MAYLRKFTEDILKKYNLYKEGEDNRMPDSGKIHFYTDTPEYTNQYSVVQEIELAEKISNSSKK
jgi:hypothetical protein